VDLLEVSSIAILCDIVVSSIIIDIISYDHLITLKGFKIYLDNAFAHALRRFQVCIETTRIVQLSYSTYNSELTPSDFFFFGYMKEKMTNHDWTTCEKIKSTIIIIFSEIGKDTIMMMFISWIKRVKWVIEHHSEYYTLQICSKG
jgi:hypothetical protein